MTFAGDQSMCLDDLGGDVTPPHQAKPVPIPEVLQELAKLEPLNTDGEEQAESMEETLRDGGTSDVAAGTSVDKRDSDKAKDVRQQQRDQDDHAATMLRSRYRKTPPKTPAWPASTQRREIATARKRASRKLFPAVTTADGAGGSPTDPEVIGVLPGSRCPAFLADLIKRFQLKIIDTPANGNCLYGAIHATTCYEVEGEDIDYEYSGHDVQILKDRILSACQEHVKLEAEPGAGRMHLLRMRISELYPTETLDQLGINHVAERLIKHYDASSDILMMVKVRYIVLHVDERRYPLP